MAKVSTPFLENRDQMITLARTAQTFNSRPSALLELSGTTAYQIDQACAFVLWEWQASQIKPQ